MIITMPIQSCSESGQPGYKWGDEGKCYLYNPSSESSKKEARRKALAQGIAIGDVDLERSNEVTTTSMGSGIKNPQIGYGRRARFLTPEMVINIVQNKIATFDQSLKVTNEYKKYSGLELLNMLDPEERMFAEALIAIAEKYGKFDTDSTGVWVEYIPQSKNDNYEIGVKCANCALHESENICKILSFEIEPGGYCRLAVIPQGYVEESEDVNKVTYGRPGRNDPRKTPAKPSERRTGSSRNDEGSAESGSSVTFSAAVTESLKSKMKEHNDKVDAQSKKATLAALKAVYRRGAGAFSVSHRPGMTRGQWAMARVNAYLYLLRNGRPSNPNYTTDNDLLPKGHPRSSK
jgi:hypothetical protein